MDPLFEYVDRLDTGGVLSTEDAARAMTVIADGRAGVEPMVRFLEAYNRRAPTADELCAFVTVLRCRAVGVDAPDERTMCNCGTGGDGRGTINVSTIAAFVIAAAGVPVAKHGNRSVSSRSGSTDCLAALGVAPSRNPADARRLLERVGLCFLNAPDFHPALRHVAPARAVLAKTGQRSVFNLLGPMLNPACVRHQSMGVFSEDVVRLVAEVLARTGTRRAYVVHGDGFDEVAMTGPTTLAEVRADRVSSLTIEPGQFGLTTCQADDLVGGNASRNAQIGEDILTGRNTGPCADMVLMNAAVGITAAQDPPNGLADAIEPAREALSSGRAHDLLCKLREASPVDA